MMQPAGFIHRRMAIREPLWDEPSLRKDGARGDNGSPKPRRGAVMRRVDSSTGGWGCANRCGMNSTAMTAPDKPAIPVSQGRGSVEPQSRTPEKLLALVDAV